MRLALGGTRQQLRCLTAFVFLCLGSSAFAQGDPSWKISQSSYAGDDPAITEGIGPVKTKKSTTIIIGGEIGFDIVSRNKRFFGASLGGARTAGVTSVVPGLATDPSAAGSSGGDVFFNPRISIDLTAQLTPTVYGVIELETPFNVFDDAGGVNTGPGAVVIGGTRTTSNSRRLLDVEQAYVKWDAVEFLKGLDLKIGIQDFSNDFTGTGNPFFVDVSHSESPFGNPVAGAMDTGTPQSPSTGLVGSQEAAGVHGHYSLSRSSNLEMFYFVIGETFRKNSDTSLMGLTYEAGSVEGMWSGGLGLYVLQSNSSSNLYTFGGGGQVSVMDEAMRLYGEAYVQFGDYRTRGATSDINQEGAFAGYIGARYTVTQSAYKPFVDVSYWELSGDDNGSDSDNGNFVSMENNNDTLVVEDGYYGLDIDTNYRALKLKAGFWPVDTKVQLQAQYSFFELQDNGSGTYSAVGTTEDKIGDEFDISLRYFATEYLQFRVATGWLLDANALGTTNDLNVTVVEASLKF